MRCTKHKHSSKESAKKCYIKELGRKSSRKNRIYQSLNEELMNNAKRIERIPPRMKTIQGIDIYYF